MSFGARNILSTTTKSAMEKGSKIILRVHGITCPGCAMDIESILPNTDDILTVSVRIAEDTIKILYDCNEIEEKQLVDRMRKLGPKTTKTGL